MKLYELGIYHHDCWNTNSINEFPDVRSMEWGSRCTQKEDNGKTNSALWKVHAANPSVLEKYVGFLKNEKGVLEARPIAKEGGDALICIRWKAEKTSYDSIMGSGSLYHSSTYSKEGYETYSIFSDEPQKMKKLIDELGEIGETRIFRIRNVEGGTLAGNRFNLTQKQMDALVFAIAQGYYQWPKKVNLQKLAERSGKSRRSVQEHLRKAEGKVLSRLLEESGKV